MAISRMQVKIIALVMVALVAGFGVLVYKSTDKEASELMESTYSKTDLLTSSVIASVENIMMGGKPESVRSLADDLRKIGGVKEIRMFNKDGVEVYTGAGYAPSDGQALSAVRSSLKSGSAFEIRNKSDLTLFKPLPSEQRCKVCHMEAEKVLGVVAVSVSLDGLGKSIAENRFWGLMNALMSMCIVALILALWLKRVVVTPMNKAVRTMDKMEKDKDLTYRMDIKSKDEMGRLSGSFNSFIDSIQTLIQRLHRVSYQVNSAATQIIVNSSRVVEGARIQARSAESTSSAVEEMNATIKEIAEASNSLYDSAETTSSSIIEMTASADEIAGSAAVLSSSVESTVSSITEISYSIKEVSSSVSVLSDAVKVGVDTMEQIVALLGKVESAAKESSKLAELATSDAKEIGAGAMARAIEGMDRIREAVDRSGEVIYRLGARSKQIGEILDIIDEVADQTELLSLNAAILASQAGEHGKGFAVVADEIKDLAERTASSTNEISKLIATVQAEAAEAVDAMDSGRRSVEEGQEVVYEAKETLEGIVASSVKSSEMSKFIEESTVEQSARVSDIEKAMSDIRDMVKNIHRATEELTVGSDQIMREADKVKNVSEHVRTSTAEQSRGSNLIIKAVENVNAQAKHIALATAEHQKGSLDIAKSIERIREITHENESLAEEMSVAVEELAKHSEELKEKAGSFKVAGAGAEMIKLGIMPLESPAQMYRKFFLLAGYLKAKTGRDIVFKLTSSFQEAVDDLGSGASDICYMTPTTYIEAHDKYGAELLVKAVRKGEPFSHTIIVARQDSPVNKLSELKGKTFAFGDRMSTSSYLVPMYMLAKAGVEVSDLAEHRFLGHHDDVAKAVLLGEVDAGGLRETTAHQYKDKGLKFLKVSESIPEFNFCARPGIDPGLAGALKDALVGLNNGSGESDKILKAIDRDYTGFMEARDFDYSGIREIVKRFNDSTVL